jgi:hypothetical protein
MLVAGAAQGQSFNPFRLVCFINAWVMCAHSLIDSLVWNDYNRKFRGGALERSTTDFVRSLILHLSV